MGELPPLTVQQPPPPNADDPVRTRKRSSGRIGVLQFNVGSLSASTHEVRSILKLLRPAVVLIQETFLTEGSVVKFEGYSQHRVDRCTPRRADEEIRGGGVMILVSTEYDNLSFEPLPPLNLPNDNTTEICRGRLSVDMDGKIVQTDILNIYIPPIHDKKAKIPNLEEGREQHFCATEILSGAQRLREQQFSWSLDSRRRKCTCRRMGCPKQRGQYWK